MFAARASVRHRRAPVVLTVIVAACGGGSSPTDSGPGGTVTPTVASVDPSVGTPGQRLTVRVLGSGFDPSAVASWERGGAADPRIVVHSTTYVSASEVLADLSIAPEAIISRYNVGVANTSGAIRKKGTGIEVFLLTARIMFDGAYRLAPVEVDTSTGQRNGSNEFWIWAKDRNRGVNDFAATRAAGTGPCQHYPFTFPNEWTEEKQVQVLEKLRDTAIVGGFGLKVVSDSIGQPASHHVSAGWMLPDGNVAWRWQIGKAYVPGLDILAPTVTKLSWNVYRYTGGAVGIIQDPYEVWGPVQSLVCPNLDTVVVTYPAP